MVKKAIFALFLGAILLVGVSCSDVSNIEGYWLSESGSSLAFDGVETVTVYGTPSTYKVYDKDKIQIVCDDLLRSFAFNGSFYIEDGILYLKNLDNGTTEAYYGKETDQVAIRNAIAVAEAEEAQRIASQKAAEAAQQDLEKQIASIRNQISRCQMEIDISKKEIDRCYRGIDNVKAAISGRYEDIADMKEALKEDITDDNKNYLLSQIEDKKQDIADYEREIEDYRNQISGYEQDIAEYEAEILALEKQLSQYK